MNHVRADVSRQTLPARGYPGNQAALRRLSRTTPHVQCKLTIGAVNDPLEAEADRVADQVMRMPDPAPSVSSSPNVVRRKCAECEEEDEKLQEKRSGQDLAVDAPTIVQQVLGTPGQPLDAASQEFFEPRFDTNLDAIRVHNDATAARSARAVGAIAYTTGRDIVFAHGRYQPQSPEGRRLLAHEITHSIQQGATGSPASVARTPIGATRVIGSAADTLQRSPECPFDYRECGGQPCTHPTGGSGFCRWSGTKAKGCVCIKIENTQLVKWVESVLLAALLAMGVVITLAALVALVACLLSGACEIAAAIALVGAAAALLIITMIKSAPGPVTLASESGGDTATGNDQNAPLVVPDTSDAETGPAPATA